MIHRTIVTLFSSAAFGVLFESAFAHGPFYSWFACLRLAEDVIRIPVREADAYRNFTDDKSLSSLSGFLMGLWSFCSVLEFSMGSRLLQPGLARLSLGFAAEWPGCVTAWIRFGQATIRSGYDLALL